MIIVSKIIKYLREHTVNAVFYGLVGIVMLFLIGLAGKNWKLFISVLSSIVKYEHFHIYVIFIVFAVVLFLLYKKTGSLKNEIKKTREHLSSNTPEQGVEPKIKYLFTNNANWKIDSKTKSFDENPYCSCCRPPSHLVKLPPSKMIFPLGEEDNHKCARTEKNIT